LEISTTAVKELRERTAAGLMDCKKALAETGGDMDRAEELMRQRGMAKAEKKQDRSACEGLVQAYVHPGDRLGALVEVNCETDFVARTDEFRELAHNLVLQVAATAPRFISPEQIPSGEEVDPKEDCLLLQPYIKDPTRTIQDIISETVAKVGENIQIKRFARFELGVEEP
jgi:elongation factor Ts